MRLPEIEPIHGLYLILWIAFGFICWGLVLLVLGAG